LRLQLQLLETMNPERAVVNPGPYNPPTSPAGPKGPRKGGLTCLIGSLLFLLLGGGFLFGPAAGAGSGPSPDGLHPISLDGLGLKVELARTRAEKTLGLSGRTSLAEGRGMLFLYPDRRVRTFWMAGMKISIDLLWLKGGEVVGVESRLPAPEPGQRPRSVTSPVPVDAVLEVPAGWAVRHRIGPGSRMTGP